jgi:hypothetical protein
MKLKRKLDEKNKEAIIKFKDFMNTKKGKWLRVSQIDNFEFDLLEVIFGKFISEV